MDDLKESENNESNNFDDMITDSELDNDISTLYFKVNRASLKLIVIF